MDHELRIKRNHFISDSPYGLFFRALTGNLPFLAIILVLMYAVHSGPGYWHRQFFHFLVPLSMVVFFVPMFIRYWPITTAVLRGDGIEFKDPFWWYFYIPAWRKILWSEVDSLTSVGTRRKNSIPYNFGVKLTGKDAGNGREVSFYLSSVGGQYVDFIDFVLLKIPKTKVDKVIFEIGKPEVIQYRKNEREKGRALGLFVGVSLVFAFLIFRPQFHRLVFYRWHYWAIFFGFWALSAGIVWWNVLRKK